MRTFLLPASIITIILWASACVPARQLQDEQAMNQRRADSLRAYLASNKGLQTGLDELRTNYDDLLKEVVLLRRDTVAFGLRYRQIQKLNNDLQDLNDEIIAKNKQLLDNASVDKQELQAELEAKQLELQNKESELAAKEADLRNSENDINALQADLLQREKRLDELESVISRQDSIVNALKKKVSDALLGFSDSDLKVTMKDGKVYVSLAEQLLFKSGSTDVDVKGQDALKKLAEVLKKNTDIEVFIEGHTDNVPISTPRIRNNWELSVLRATAIVEILTKAGVDAKQITAAGRGEFHPVSTNGTTEGKRQNRRTEIILSPKLDELYQLLEK